METIDPVQAVQTLRQLGYNHFVGAFGQMKEDNTVDVYHVVGYVDPPTPVDTVNLVNELATDETFSMTEMVCNKDFILVEFDESFFE